MWVHILYSKWASQFELLGVSGKVQWSTCDPTPAGWSGVRNPLHGSVIYDASRWFILIKSTVSVQTALGKHIIRSWSTAETQGDGARLSLKEREGDIHQLHQCTWIFLGSWHDPSVYTSWAGWVSSAAGRPRLSPTPLNNLDGWHLLPSPAC